MNRGRITKTLTTALLVTPVPGTALAGGGKPFANLRTDDTWRAGMSLKFSLNTLERDHAVSVFPNIEGMRLASTRVPRRVNGMSDGTPRPMPQAFIAERGRVILCPMRMKQAGIDRQDLIERAAVGRPDVTLPALLADDTRVMSY